MVKVNLTVRVPAEVRQLIEELSRRYGMGMGDIVAFVFNEFRGEIVKRLEARAGFQQQAESRSEGGDILSRLMDTEAQPVTEEGYYLRQISDFWSGNMTW
jgi:hypothetical protein